MKEDAEAAREKAKIEQENAIRKRKEEREEMEKRIAENRRNSRSGIRHEYFCFYIDAVIGAPLN